jgi:hypothetical protein
MAIDRSDVGVTNDSSEEEAVNRQALFLEPNEENAGYKAAQAFALHVTELPEDVLRIIFDLMCQSSGSGARLTISTHPAMVLSYVCSAWRHIILEMPHVWSRVSLRIKFTGDVLPRSRVQMYICLNVPKHRLFHLWLTRGGSLPRAGLTIDHINHYDVNSDVVQQLVAPFPFLKLRLRLERNEMESPNEIPPEHLSHLELLHIGCYDSDRYCDYDEVMSFMDMDIKIFCHVRATLRLPVRLPNLVDLTLCKCFAALNLDKLISAVPWHNLKELHLQFPIPSLMCFDIILRQGVSLMDCALRPTLDATFSSLPDTKSPIVLPQMEILVLDCVCRADIEKFKRLVLTPAASTRHIEIWPYYDDGDYRDCYRGDDDIVA